MPLKMASWPTSYVQYSNETQYIICTLLQVSEKHMKNLHQFCFVKYSIYAHYRRVIAWCKYKKRKQKSTIKHLHAHEVQKGY